MDVQVIRLGLVAFGMAITIGLSLVGAIGWILDRSGRRRLSRAERSIARCAHVALAVGLGCFLYGVFIEADWVEVTHHELQTPKLPAGTRLRIAHLSDLHTDRMSRALRKIPELLAREKPDLLVFTGDTVNARQGGDVFRRWMSELHAPLGRYAVRGNHDVWYWSELDLFGGGVATELNDATPAWLLDQKVALCGAAYGVTGPLPACIDAAKGRFTVVAYHTPDLIEELAPRGPDLYLAGHTHGGQVRAPLFGAIITMSKFDKKYEMGRYAVGPTTLYVNRGIGFERDAPRVRFLCRPELAIVDVVGTGQSP